MFDWLEKRIYCFILWLQRKEMSRIDGNLLICDVISKKLKFGEKLLEDMLIAVDKCEYSKYKRITIRYDKLMLEVKNLLNIARGNNE